MALGIDLNELKSLVDLLRAEGVSSFTKGDLQINLGEIFPDLNLGEIEPHARPPALEGLPAAYFDEALGLTYKVNK